MPRRLLLDGDDLPALMQRVRAEMGPDAVIVKAERVRTGGVAGFFAKEHFEVTVEVPDGARSGQRPRVPGPARSGAVGMSALLDAADAADGGPRGPQPHATGGAPDRDPAAPRVSTDGDTFASLLASIDDMADVRPAATAAAPATVAATADVAAPPGPTRPGEPGPATAPEEPAADVPSPHPPARFAPQGARVTAATFGPLTPVAPAEPAIDGPAGPAAADAAAGEPAAPARTAPDAPGAVGARADAAAPAGPGGGDRRALGALGVPASVLGTGPLDEALPLSRLLGALPRPPAPLRTPGAVVAVVGEGPQALAVAVQLGQRARLDSRDVVLAGVMAPVAGHGRRLQSPAAAARHRAKVEGSEQVSVVAVGVGPDAEDWAAAAELLAELAPDQSWAVVDARRKTSDLRAWMTALAGDRPFDAVAAAWVHETQEPGTVLDLGAPVGWIDGLPATPVVWAAVLSERLDDAARWD